MSTVLLTSPPKISSTKPIISNTISKSDYQSLVEKCIWLQSSLRNLDHQLNNCTFRLQSVQDQRLSKCWFALNLVELRRLTNLVVRLMFELQTATIGKSINTDYYKYALDQLCYFEFLWRCYFVERILELNNQFRNYMTKHNQQIREAMKSSKQLDGEKSKELGTEDSLIKIMKDVQPTLANVNRTKKRIEKIPELDLANEHSIIKMKTNVQKSSDEDKQEDVNKQNVINEIGESSESLNQRKQTKLDPQTAKLLESENRETADLIALGQLEASMRVNQQLMECIRNHISMAKLTVLNIYETGQRTLHSVQRTSTSVKLTTKISRLTNYSRSLTSILIVFILIMIIIALISHLNDVKVFFKNLFKSMKSNK